MDTAVLPLELLHGAAFLLCYSKTFLLKHLDELFSVPREMFKKTEHKKILDAFQGLPRDIKKYILTFFHSKITVQICPECGSGCFTVLVPLDFQYFQCEHNYYPIYNRKKY